MELLKQFATTFLAVVAYGCDLILGIAEDPATTQALIDNALIPVVEVIRELLILTLPLGLMVAVWMFPFGNVCRFIKYRCDEAKVDHLK